MYLLLLLSVPVLYIYGLIRLILDLIRFQEKKAPLDRRQFLEQAIIDLDNTINKTPSTTLSEQLSAYRAQLFAAQTVVAPRIQTPQTEHESFSVANWYSENSINVLLYIGAFLIVASVSIFVGFQWETLSPVTRGGFITVFTLLWFIFGSWFVSVPKVRSAGMTFLAIGALLIPFCGMGWYNFVLEPMGADSGVVWLITTLAALPVYYLLAANLRKKFYGYLVSLGAFSLVFSIIDLRNLAYDYYILGTILTSIVLLVLARNQALNLAENNEIFAIPIEYSAQILAPLALFYGLILSAVGDRLFTLETTLGVISGASFYLTTYIYRRFPPFFAVFQILVYASIYFCLKWLSFPSQTILYILQLVSFSTLIGAYFFRLKNREALKNITLHLSVITSVLWYMSALAANLETQDKLVFSVFVAGIALIQSIFYGYKELRYLANIIYFIALIHVFDLFKLDYNHLPLAFTGLSWALYILSTLFPDDQEASTVYQTSALVSAFFISLFFGAYHFLLKDTLFYKDYTRQLSVLAAAYSAFFVYVAEAVRSKRTLMRYLASGMGVLVYVWQLKFAEVTELQIYTSAIGAYFLVLAFLRHEAGDNQRRDLFDGLGLFVLLFFSIIQTFAEKPIYALVLGIEGTLLVFLGNLGQSKRYTYTGITAIVLAVLSQTYDEILELPRWLLTGAGGFLFILIALYLMVYKKHPESR